MDRTLSTEALRRLSPALVIVQAGFDDTGGPAGLEKQRAGATAFFTCGGKFTRCAELGS